MKQIATIILAVIFLAGCDSIERQAYTLVIGAGAFIKSMSAQLPGCALVPPSMATPSVCEALNKARAAKDLLIDATEVYCAGPNFNIDGPCEPPKKGTPSYIQTVAKLQAAMSAYNQAAADLKGAMHGLPKPH